MKLSIGTYLTIGVLCIGCGDADIHPIEDSLPQERTPLPIVSLVTPDGEDITSKEVWLDDCSVTLTDARGDTLWTDTAAHLRCRGNSTFRLPKKPYNIKLDRKREVLGMPAHKRWCLLADAFDRTHLKNDVALRLGQMTSLRWTPSGTHVLVMLNGRELGLYYLCEHIKVGSQRLDIAEMTEQDTEGDVLTGGYLLEYDKYFDEANRFRSAVRAFPVNIKEPDEDVLQPEQEEYIRGYINRTEQLLYEERADYATLQEWIDMESFADFYLISELTYDMELARPRSTYLHKDRNCRLAAGPLWDFDWAWKEPAADRLELAGSLYYDRLLRLPEFDALVRERWQGLRRQIPDLVAYLDAQAAAIRGQAIHDRFLWQSISRNSNKGMEYDDAVEALRSAIGIRAAALDRRFSDSPQMTDVGLTVP